MTIMEDELKKLLATGIYRRRSDTMIENRHCTIRVVFNRNPACPEYHNSGRSAMLWKTLNGVGDGKGEYFTRANQIVYSIPA